MCMGLGESKYKQGQQIPRVCKAINITQFSILSEGLVQKIKCDLESNVYRIIWWKYKEYY